MKEDKEGSEFYFRDIHPGLFFGTTSDRYSGWIGQIYSKERYKGRLRSRTKSLDGNSYNETVLPVDSVAEYFRHFPLLEIDFTFYRPLFNRDGDPSQNYHVLQSYRRYLNPEDKIIVKVPQGVFAKKIKRGGVYEDNPDYLNPDYFLRRFYRPAVDILGENLSGFIFEQEYQRKDPLYGAGRLAEDLASFFGGLPADGRYHVEIRTDRLIKEPVLDVLEKQGVGLVLSHWTWLPSLKDQYGKLSGRRLNKDGVQVIRLLTPRGKNYAQTYAEAFPFSRLIDGMMNPDMIDDTVEIIRGEIKAGRRILILVNNRAGGNAPQTARMIVDRLGGVLED